MPTSTGNYFVVAVGALTLTGCSTRPVFLNAIDGCDVAPNVWHQVAVLSEREALLDLPDKLSKAPVREHLKATSGQREVWFEDSNRNLQACFYNPEKSCYSAERRKVVFRRLESSWEAGPTMQILCRD